MSLFINRSDLDVPPGDNSRSVEGVYRLPRNIESRILTMASQIPSGEAERQIPGAWQYGRFYGEPYNVQPSGHPEADYVFPVDLEEKNRMDVFHHFTMLLRGGRLLRYDLPYDRPVRRVLDVGTGTGIWAINACQTFENTVVHGIDLHFIQPQFIPRNYTTEKFNAESSTAKWQSKLGQDFDAVYIRTLLGSIQNDKWLQTYQGVFSVLRPNVGRIEQVELDWTPHWDDAVVIPNPCRQDEWGSRFLAGMDRFGKSARVDGNRVRELMTQAGFVEFEEQVMRCYVNPSTGHAENDSLAQWFNLVYSNAIHALALKPMVEQLGMSVDEVNRLCDATKDECCRLSYRAYYNLHIWTARKPA